MRNDSTRVSPRQHSPRRYPRRSSVKPSCWDADRGSKRCESRHACAPRSFMIIQKERGSQTCARRYAEVSNSRNEEGRSAGRNQYRRRHGSSPAIGCSAQSPGWAGDCRGSQLPFNRFLLQTDGFSVPWVPRCESPSRCPDRGSDPCYRRRTRSRRPRLRQRSSR